MECSEREDKANGLYYGDWDRRFIVVYPSNLAETSRDQTSFEAYYRAIRVLLDLDYPLTRNNSAVRLREAVVHGGALSVPSLTMPFKNP